MGCGASRPVSRPPTQSRNVLDGLACAATAAAARLAGLALVATRSDDPRRNSQLLIGIIFGWPLLAWLASSSRALARAPADEAALLLARRLDERDALPQLLRQYLAEPRRARQARAAPRDVHQRNETASVASAGRCRRRLPTGRLLRPAG